MKETKIKLINRLLPIVLIIASICTFLFMDQVFPNPGIVPIHLRGWDFIFGFLAPVSSLDDPGNSVTGLGFSYLVLFIPILSLIGVIILVISLFDIQSKVLRMTTAVLFLLVGFLCITAKLFINYAPIIDDSYNFIPIDGEDLNLDIGTYVSSLLAITAVGLITYKLFNDKADKSILK